LSPLLKSDLLKLKHDYCAFFINLPVAKFLHDTAYILRQLTDRGFIITLTLVKAVFLDVHRSDGDGILV